jgi:hypothetical protein
MLGGGCSGSFSDPFIDSDSTEDPIGEAGEIEIAQTLARWREFNRWSAADLGLPVEFASDESPPQSSWPPLNMHLAIDWTVPAAFLTALEDGFVTTEEIIRIVELPANREWLTYCRSCEAVSTRPLGEADLAFHISRAGSSDPLDRLWCWLNPMHHYGYADLALNGYQYRRLFDELQRHEEEIAHAVAARIAPFLPPDVEVHETVALSVCCPISTWTTSGMVGFNVEHLKGCWEHLVRTIAAAVFDQLQRQLCPTKATPEGLTVGDLDCGGSGNSRSCPLEWAIYTSVLRGTADYVADFGASDDEESDVKLGAELLHCYAALGINSSQSTLTASLPPEVNDPRRPLCALGRHMARIITAYEGPRALTELIRRGPAVFVTRAAEIESFRGHDLLTPETCAAVRELARNCQSKG